MFQTCFHISSTAARRFVVLRELLDARILDEAERSAAAETSLEAGNQIGLDQHLSGREAFSAVDFAVHRDAVVERVGAFDDDGDVVLGKSSRHNFFAPQKGAVENVGKRREGEEGKNGGSEAFLIKQFEQISIQTSPQFFFFDRGEDGVGQREDEGHDGEKPESVEPIFVHEQEDEQREREARRTV